MTKRGSAYEEIVGAVCAAIDPGASVEVGKWIAGPDGRRDMDVAVRGTRESLPFFALIECKDWKNPVGVAVVDALESKRHDLGADVSTIFSNSGFTADAARKARRVGISLCSAVKAGDLRIRVRIDRDFHARIVSVDSWSIRVFRRGQPPPIGELIPHKLRYQGKPVLNWISDKSKQLLAAHPDEAYIQAEYAFGHELEFEYDGSPLHLIGLVAQLDCSQGWVRQTVREDVSLGSYDFLNRRLIVPDKQLWHLGPFDNQAWEATDELPPEEPLETNSFRVNLTITRPVGPIAGAGTPELDEKVKEHAVVFKRAAV